MASHESVQSPADKGPMSCAECRRLKRRCDRKVPCQNCVKKGCVEICPNGTNVKRKELDPKDSLLKDLRDLLANHGLLLKPATLSPPPSDPPVTTVQPSSAQHGSTHTFDRPSSSAPLWNAHLSDADTLGAWESAAALTASRVSFQGVGKALPDTGPLSKPIGTEVEGGRTIVPGLSNHGRSYASVIYQGCDDAPESPIASLRLPVSPQTPDRAMGNFSVFGPASASHCKDLLRRLPSEPAISLLVAAFYRYFAPLNDCIAQPEIYRVISNVRSYDALSTPIPAWWFELAMLQAVLAVGSLYMLGNASPTGDGRSYAEGVMLCLTQAGYLRACSDAGVEALRLLAHYYMETSEDHGSNMSWQLWGMANRIVQDMEMHREPEGRVTLLPRAVQNRKRIFWQCYADDVTAANGRMRPSSFCRKYITVRLPNDTPSACWSRSRFRLARLSHEILDHTLENIYYPYVDVLALDQRLHDTRNSLLIGSQLSVDIADLDGDFTHMLQRTALAVLCDANFLFLHRPFFARAIQDADPLSMPFAKSFLAVSERSSIIISAVADLHRIAPVITARHSVYWYHLFAAAASLGSLIINCPSNPLVPFASTHLARATDIYASFRQHMRAPIIEQNHHMLLTLQRRGVELASTITPFLRHLAEPITPQLLRWEARLIESTSTTTYSAVPSSHERLPTVSNPLFYFDPVPPYNPLVRARQEPPLTNEFAGGQTIVDGVGDDWFTQLWQDLFTSQ